jgi:glycerophosphoryl diester phosphodiesterase
MAPPANRRPLLLGHRGCRLRKITENSIAAFDMAIAAGCDGFEFDLRLTSDGRLVCLHDESVRGCSVPGADYKQLTKHYLKYFGSNGTTGIGVLEDVLASFSSRCFLDIELKVSGAEALVAALVRGLDPTCYLISSFLPEVLNQMAEIEPAIPLGYISRRLDHLSNWPNLPGSYVIPRHDLVSKELIAHVHQAGRKLITWTVNRPREMHELAQLGVDGLISDDPKLLYETLGLGR